MGGVQRTVEKLEVVKIQPDENLLLVKGAVPGSPGSLLIIQRAKKGS